MSLEPSSRPTTITILSSRASVPSSPSPSDATRLSSATITLSPQAEPFTMSSVAPSPPATDAHSPSPHSSSSPTPADAGSSKPEAANEPDPSIIEALKSKERLYVLRVGEEIERLINERKARIEVSTATSYQRLLVHRCSAYYRVVPESDTGSKSIWITSSSESRIPTRRISELAPVEQAKQPAIKIMSRSAQDRIRAQSQSRTGSVNGEDAESSDVEPSEAGSLGGRRLKKNLTLEEREAAYNEARSRIFMDFEEKAKEKENDMSASSSTFSLVSGSASTSGGGSSSAGDIDDSISTAPTESEFSGPVARENKNERRNGSGANSTGSSKSMLSPKHSTSSRNSRAPSPSFTYASIYEPLHPQAHYDPGQPPPMQQPYAAQYMYSYPPPPPGQPAGQNYMTPYPYYPYGYPPPPHHPPGPDPSGSPPDPQNPGPFVNSPPHPQQMVYMPPYQWAPNPAGSPGAPHSGTPSPPHPQYSYGPAPAPPPQYGGYNMPTYFPTMSPMHTPSPGIQGQQQQLQHPMQPPVNMAPSPPTNDLGIRVMPPITMNSPAERPDLGGRRRGNSRTGGGSWSYGPGYGYPFGAPGSTPSPIEGGPGTGAVVGPRLNSVARRTSGTSNGSRTPGDEASSVTSSTSSSSRTTSSQHPLPPRPDWAVGLKPNPTLHPPRPPARNGAGPRANTASAPSVLLQPADFPPLGGARAPPVPVPSGVWRAREPHAPADGGERVPAKGPGAGLVGAPAGTGTAHAEDAYMQSVMDGIGALALGSSSSAEAQAYAPSS
ncbi:hypothetical protein BC834DRAFT_344559 [Gloeopeniophorella convolvens]|nr:hypothetical protein BC834DRAFT_344559 [Gloeopeniophorella convolvens]